ncbi:hypothetical protein MATL_G00065520 [Megalops atlanticus]|uniref:Myb-like domain-containing protein n=1 Tax=Megalops atlanticus TaxID=7932 RepID=A0A9D3Q7S6_MEGAT|nr:hypothetical protein MATL_G00065520 [Megalops atlanticus]
MAKHGTREKRDRAWLASCISRDDTQIQDQCATQPADTTHAAETEGKEPESAAAPEPPGGWSADTARVNDSQDQAPDKVSPNLGEGGQNGGTIGDNPVGAAALQRRKRFSAMPNLTKPRVSGDTEDRKKLVKAYKLKEMMKLERSKERVSSHRSGRRHGKQRRGKHPIYDYSGPLDRSKMTMRDLLYYLPETNPMSTPVMEEQLQTERGNPPSPNKELQEKKQDDEDEFEEDDNVMDEQLLVPKVKVAEDGSLVIDEDSLTVEVLKAKAPAVVEENDPIFERGSTTTYSSFRKLCHTKVWSNRETDMFFLAISMVGTDFSLICQLFPHRTRAEIKNKFKREERANSWRIDKAFGEKRPFDLKFFSTLLELVLAADKKKRNKPKKKASGGAKPRPKQKAKRASAKGANGDQVASDLDVDSDAAAGDSETAEKENEDCSNVVESADEPVTTKRKRKRRKKDEEEKEDKEEKRRRRRRGSPQSKGRQKEEGENGAKKHKMPAAEEADLSQTMDSVEEGMGEPEGKPARKSRGRTQKPAPKLGRARRTKKARESEERPGEMEEEEGVADGDSVPKASDEAAAPKRRRAKRGRIAVPSSDEEDVDGDPLVDPDLLAVQEEMLNKPTRSGRLPKIPKRLKQAEEEESPTESPPPSPPPSTAPSPRGRGKQSGRKPQPNLAAKQKRKPKRVTEDREEEEQEEEAQQEEEQQEAARQEEAQQEEAQQEEEQRHPAGPEEEVQDPTLILLGLSLVEPPPEELEVSTHVPVPPCTARSEDANCSESGVEGAQETRQNLSLQDVIESLPSELLEGLGESEENADEAACALLALSNADPLSLPAATHSPEAVNTLEPPSMALLEEKEAGLKFMLEVVDQSQYSTESSQAVTSEPSATAVSEPVTELVPLSEPLDPAVETPPSREEPDRLEEKATTASTGVSQDKGPGLESPVQSVPQGRRSRFPKPKPNLGRAARASHTPVPQSPAAPTTDAGTLKTAEEEKNDPDKDRETKEEEAPLQDPEKGSDGEKHELSEAVSCQDTATSSDFPVQSAPQGRRSRFPKPKPNLGRGTRSPHVPVPQSPAAPTPDDAANNIAPEDSNTLMAVEKKPPSSNTALRGASVEKNEAVMSPEVMHTEEGTSTDETVIEEARRARSITSSPECSPQPHLQPSLADRSPTVPDLAQNKQEHQSELVSEQTDQSQYSSEPSQAVTSEPPATAVSEPVTELVPLSEPLDPAVESPPSREECDTLEERAPPARTSTNDAGGASSNFSSPACLPQSYAETELRDPAAEGVEFTQATPVSFDTPQNKDTVEDKPNSLSVDTAGSVPGDEATNLCVEGDISSDVTMEATQGVSWGEDLNEEEPTFILTLFEIPHPQIGEYESGAEPLGPVSSQEFSPLMFVDPQSQALPTESEPDRCDKLSSETKETRPGCGTMTNLLLSDALVPVSEGQEEDTKKEGTALPKLSPHTDPPENEGETSFCAVTEDIVQGLADSNEEDHGSQTLVQVAESHDSQSHMEAAKDKMNERAVLSQEERKQPMRTRRSKLQVKPCISKRKPRQSPEDEQGTLTEDPDQPGPAQTSPQTPQHKASDPDVQQDSEETDPVASDLSASGEQCEGIVGRSDLPQEEGGVTSGAEGTEMSIGGAEPPLSHHSATISSEPLSVETEEGGSGCDMVTHLLLSDALVPVSEGQEEDAEQDWTSLQKLSPHTDQVSHTEASESEGDSIFTAKDNLQDVTDTFGEEDFDNQTVLPVAESHDPVLESHDPVTVSHDSVESGTGNMNERATLSQEKGKQPSRSRRSKLQVKPCLSKRKPRKSPKDEQGTLTKDPDQSGPAQTSPQIPQHKASNPDVQQDSVETDCVASDLSASGEQSEGIVGRSDLPQEEGGVTSGAEGTEMSIGGAEPPLSHHSATISSEPLSVETEEGGSGCDLVTHLLLSDALVPVSEGQEEDAEQDWTSLQKLSPHTDQVSHTEASESEGDSIFTAKDNLQDITDTFGEEDFGNQTVLPVAESHDPVLKSHDSVTVSHDSVESGTGNMNERATLSQEKGKQPSRSRRSKLQVKPCISKRKPRQSPKDEQGTLTEDPDQPGPAQTSPQIPQHKASNPDVQQDSMETDVCALGEGSQGIVGHSDLPQEERDMAAGAEGTDKSIEGTEFPLSLHSTMTSCEPLSAETDETGPECDTVTHLLLRDVLVLVSEGQEEDTEQDWTAFPNLSSHTDPPGNEGETPSTAVAKDNVQGHIHSHEEDHGNATLIQVAESRDMMEAVTQDISDGDTLSQEKKKQPVRRCKLQVKPSVSKRKPRRSTKDEQGTEHPDLPGPAQTSPRIPQPAPSESKGETSLTVSTDNAESPAGGPAVCGYDCGSSTLAHDLSEAVTEGMGEQSTLSQGKRKQPIKSRRSKLQVKPCISKRKPGQSTKNEQGILTDNPDQPGPAQTSPQTPQHRAPDPDVQQDSVETDAVASDVSAAGEQSKGIVGCSDLPQEEGVIAAGAEAIENSSGGKEEQLKMESPPLTSQGPLTRCGRKPKGFLSFISNSSDAGPAGHPGADKPLSQKPRMNTSHMGRKRTAKGAPTEVSPDSSTLSSPPSKVRVTASPSGPSPERVCSQPSESPESEFLCATTSEETEEEPTSVAQYFFSDVLVEVEEPD